MQSKQKNPHAELCDWANGLRSDSPQFEAANMSKHTPGPWHINKFMDDEDDSYSIDDDTGQVAKTYCDGNAKLIAAAPELLEASLAMVEWFRKEKAGFGKDRSTPEGEAAWRDWWNEQLALCDRSETLAAAAVEKATA